MNLKNRPPVLVPKEYRAELEQCSKAFLMDIVWDYSMQLSGDENDNSAMQVFRGRRDIISMYWKK
jgi:hypothetical protein